MASDGAGPGEGRRRELGKEETSQTFILELTHTQRCAPPVRHYQYLSARCHDCEDRAFDAATQPSICGRGRDTIKTASATRWPTDLAGARRGVEGVEGVVQE